jgi:hypothetical protein
MTASPLMDLATGLASELERPTLLVLVERQQEGAFGVAHAIAGLSARELEGAIGILLETLASSAPDHSLCPDCAGRPDRARAALAELNVITVPPRESQH